MNAGGEDDHFGRELYCRRCNRTLLKLLACGALLCFSQKQKEKPRNREKLWRRDLMNSPVGREGVEQKLL